MPNPGQVVPFGFRHGQKIELNPGLASLESSLIHTVSLACGVERNESLQLARCSRSMPGTQTFSFTLPSSLGR